MHELLDLRHHRHTGKRMHHSHTSYRGLFVLLAIFGLALLFVVPVSASDYTVTATVPAPIPTIAPTVDNFVSGAVVTSANQTVSGTCQVINPAVVISVWSGANRLASGACSVTGSYSLLFTLSDGVNNLIVKQETTTGDPGPSSQPFVLQLSIPPTGSSPAPAPTIDSGIPALALSDVPSVLTFRSKKSFTLTFKIQGGVAPYIIKIDWGDGVIKTQKVETAGPQTFEYTYDSSDNHTIIIQTSDANKTTLQHSVAAITLAPRSVAVPAGVITSASPSIANLPRLVWNSYFVISFGVVLLWATGVGSGKDALLTTIWSSLFHK